MLTKVYSKLVRGDISAHKTTFIFIDVHVPSQESKLSCVHVCVRCMEFVWGSSSLECSRSGRLAWLQKQCLNNVLWLVHL